MPRILIGNTQLSPAAMSMSPVEFSPQFASVVDAEQSGAAGAEDAGATLVAATISARAAALDKRIVNFLVFMQIVQGFPNEGYHNPELDARVACGAKMPN